MMLDTMLQHPGTVQCALFEWLGFRELYLFKKITPYFLLAKMRAFCPESTILLFPKVVSTILETLDVFGLFLKMFLLFRSYHICY